MEIIFHILAWIVIFVLPHMLVYQTKDPDANHQLLVLLGAPISLAIVFYVNYFWLVPRYFQNDLQKKFVVFNIVLYFFAFIAMNMWNKVARPTHDAEQPHRIELTEHPKERFLSPNDIPHHRDHPYDVRVNDRGDSKGWLFVIYEVRDILLYVLITILAIFIQQSNSLHKAEKARQLAELRQSEAEVRWLINQVSPHFLLNTLNNIYALIAIDQDQAQHTVESLSKMLRHMLYENHNEYTLVGKEVEFVSKYVELMKLRVSSCIDIQMNTDIEGCENMKVTPLLLIPLVENAFKHGINNTEPSFVHIHITAKDETLHCLIKNSNHPKTQSDRSGSGIGLELMQKRLESTYPGEYTWEHGTTDDGINYQTDLTIKLKA